MKKKFSSKNLVVDDKLEVEVDQKAQHESEIKKFVINSVHTYFFLYNIYIEFTKKKHFMPS